MSSSFAINVQDYCISAQKNSVDFSYYIKSSGSFCTGTLNNSSHLPKADEFSCFLDQSYIRTNVQQISLKLFKLFSQKTHFLKNFITKSLVRLILTGHPVLFKHVLSEISLILYIRLKDE